MIILILLFITTQIACMDYVSSKKLQCLKVFKLTDTSKNKDLDVTRKWYLKNVILNKHSELCFDYTIVYGSDIKIGYFYIPNIVTDYKLPHHTGFMTLAFDKKTKKMISIQRSDHGFTETINHRDFINSDSQVLFENKFCYSNGKFDWQILNYITSNNEQYFLNKKNILQLRLYPKYNLAIGLKEKIERAQNTYPWSGSEVMCAYKYYLYKSIFNHKTNELLLYKLYALKELDALGLDNINQLFFSHNGKSIIAILINGEIYRIKRPDTVSKKYYHFYNGFDCKFMYL